MTGRKLSMAAARRELKPLGIRIGKTMMGDIKVNFQGGKEATAYYTDDLEDALGTGKLMAERRDQPAAMTDKLVRVQLSNLLRMQAHRLLDIARRASEEAQYDKIVANGIPVWDAIADAAWGIFADIANRRRTLTEESAS